MVAVRQSRMDNAVLTSEVQCSTGLAQEVGGMTRAKKVISLMSKAVK